MHSPNTNHGTEPDASPTAPSGDWSRKASDGKVSRRVLKRRRRAEKKACKIWTHDGANIHVAARTSPRQESGPKPAHIRRIERRHVARLRDAGVPPAPADPGRGTVL